MIADGSTAATLGFCCASPKGDECGVPCDQGGEGITLFLDADDPSGPRSWPRCPVRETYDDPRIRHVLALRQAQRLGGAIDLVCATGWVVDLWAALDDAIREHAPKPTEG